MKMKQKISLGMLGIVILFVTAGWLALLSMQKNQQRLEDFIDKDVVALQLSNSLHAQGIQMEQALRNIVLAPSAKAAYGNHEEASKEFDETMKAALAMANGKPARLKSLQEIAEMRKRQAALHGKVIGIASSNQGAAIELINAEGTPLWRNMKARLLDTIKTDSDAFQSARSEAVASTNTRFAITLAVMAAAVIAGIAVSIWIVRSVTQPLSQALGIAQTIASGNLNTQIDVSRKDEFGELLEAMSLMNNALQNMIWHVRQGVDTFTTATREIASGNQDLSSRTEEQASSLEETASSMEQLTSTVRQNADNARQANQLALVAADVATKGGTVVNEVVNTMHAIDASSKKIADIINVIDGIAFQTNILALNAAVEAARAGEQGRGFAVVATEVRSLAQRSAAAAREIKALIEDSVSKVEIGNRLVDQAGSTMHEVVTSIRRVTDIMGEISEASREQSEGIEQVNQAITQMDTVTQQNAALVEEAAAAAEALQNQANELASFISVFKVKTARYGTMEEAYEMVQKAVAYLKEHGREKGFAEICNRLGRFNDRDLYVVVYDLNGRNLAHGAFPAMVGKDLIDAKDGGGKFYVRERLAIVKAHGKGWQDYTFTNPVTKQMEPKSMYLEQLDDYIVGCGAYKR